MIEGTVEPEIEPQDHANHEPDIGLHAPLSAHNSELDSAQNGVNRSDTPRACGHVDDMARKAFESLANSKPPKV